MIQFAPFRFDEIDLTLWHGQQPRPLTRKASHLFACLLAARGHWVSKAEILAAVWPDTHVHPDNIKVLVREIRLALHDDAGHPRFIRSEAGRGYAFVAETVDHRGRAIGASEPPLVIGRAGELAALMEALDAVRAGSSRVALVVGEHGAGKSTLCDTFLRVARATMAIRTATAECISAPHAPEPLLPFQDAFRACCRDQPALLSRLTSAAPSWSARAPEWVQGMISSPADPAPLVAELAPALAALAEGLPLVLVLEDVQWGDAASLEAVAALAGASHRSKWLLVATAYPVGSRSDNDGLREIDRAVRSSASSFVLELQPWTRAHVERYLDVRFGAGCATDLAPSVHDVSGGNPSMVSAAADRLAECGVLEFDADGPMRDPQRDAVRVARALRAVVMMQLERLTAEERALLEAASAIGPSFATATAAVAADIAEAEADRLLDDLARRRLMVGRDAAPRRGVAANAYRFLHALHLGVLSERAPITQEIRSARRLAEAAERARPAARRRQEGWPASTGSSTSKTAPRRS
jgi:predicted ATPase/DNA-binding winged helix-turn-helix (wHTH) protein